MSIVKVGTTILSISQLWYYLALVSTYAPYTRTAGPPDSIAATKDWATPDHDPEQTKPIPARANRPKLRSENVISKCFFSVDCSQTYLALHCDPRLLIGEHQQRASPMTPIRCLLRLVWLWHYGQHLSPVSTWQPSIINIRDCSWSTSKYLNCYTTS